MRASTVVVLVLAAGCNSALVDDVSSDHSVGTGTGTSRSGVSNQTTPIDQSERSFPIYPIDAEAHERAAAPAEDQPTLGTTQVTTVSLRSLMSPIKDQLGRPNCQTFAATGLLERYISGPQISEQCMLYESKGDGGIIYYRLKDFIAKGAVDQRLCPYSNDFNQHVPPGLTYQQLVARSNFNMSRISMNKSLFDNPPNNNEMFNVIKNLIDSRTPIGIGIYYIDDSFHSDGTIKVDGVPKCNGKEFKDLNECSGHAMVITGYRSDGFLEVRNSWGPGWGDRGYGWMAFDYLRRFRAGGFVMISVDSPQPYEDLIIPMYKETIGRNPQQWEVTIWSHRAINDGPSPRLNLMAGRAAFLRDSQATDAVVATYWDTLYRNPNQTEIDAWLTNLRVNNWTIPKMSEAFKSDAQHADAIVRVYQDVFGRTPSANEIDAWKTNMKVNGWTISTMRGVFADDLQTREAIKNSYMKVLHRSATSEEIDKYQAIIRDNYDWSIARLEKSL